MRGYFHQLPDLQLLISEYNPICLCLQETKLKTHHQIKLKGYSYIDSQYNREKSNTAILVRNDIPFHKINVVQNLRCTAVQIHIGRWYTICSLYLPPSEHINEIELENLFETIPKPYLILGDLNGRHTLWHDVSNNTRGRTIERLLYDKSIFVMNNSGPTHIDSRTKTETCIDLSLCSSNIALDFTWKLENCLHGSDHYPIIMDTNINFPCDRPEKWHFDKANWQLFKNLIDFDISEDFRNVDDMIAFFIAVIIRAAHASIFRSGGRNNKKTVPWWTPKCKEAIQKKRRAWRMYKRNKTEVNYINFKRLSAVARRTIREAKRECWRKFVSTINSYTPITAVWQKIHKIVGKYQRNVAPIIIQNGIKIADPKEVAEILAKHFSQISRGDHLSKRFLNHKVLEERHILDFSTTRYFSYNDVFSMRELLSALSKCKPTAAGPDGIHYEFLKHLPIKGKEFLLNIINTIFTTHDYPQWNGSTMLAFLKPGKTGYSPGDYRPIALTSCICKLYERMINARLQWLLESKGILSPFQHGFRKNRSTCDALVALEMYIREAFAAGKFVISVFFDLEKAYDTTWRYHIMKELHDEGFRGNLPIAIKKIIENRTFIVKVGQSTSTSHTQFEGVPQGGVLSTTLFILAINKIGRNLPHGIRASLYVDDYSISFAGNNVRTIQNKMQEAINTLSEWTELNGFKFSTAKTCAVTFSRQHTIHQPRLTLYGKPIQYKHKCKFLGVTFDTRLTFLPHIEELKTSCTERLNILRVISHKTWGADRKMLLRLHEALILSKLDYGSQVYGSASPTYLKKLDSIHNTGLRLATGAFRSTPIVSLYAESGFYSLEYRRTRLSLRYALKINSKYSPYLYRNVYNTASLPVFETHPRYLKPFNIRLDSLLTQFRINSNVTPVHYSKLAPWKIDNLEYCKDLINVKKNQITDVHFRNLFYEHFNEHKNSFSIFTDGSKTDEGVGFAIAYEQNSECRRIPKEASVFTAELFAILLALKRVYQVKQKSFVIVSDSRSALMAIENYNSPHPIVVDIQEWFYMITNQEKSVKFCWVPSHVGVSMNEIADNKAKQAIQVRQVTEKSLPFTDFYPIIDKAIRNDWQSKWNREAQTNKLRQIKDTVAKWTTSYSKNRRWEVVLSRLRLGHSRLTHGFLMENKPPPICQQCNTPLTIKHIFIDCQKYIQQRNKYFRLYGNNLDLKLLLQESNIFDIKKIIGFLVETGLLKTI